MQPATIPCPRCHGNGQRTLTKTHQRVFDAIKKLESATVPEIIRHLKERVSPTTINHRVSRLEGWKLVRGVGGERKKRYSVVA